METEWKEYGPPLRMGLGLGRQLGLPRESQTAAAT